MKKLFVIAMVAALAVASQAQTGGGRGFGGGARGQSLTGLLQRADVQTELKLRDDQKSKLPQQGQRGGAGGGQRGGAGGGQNGGGGGGGVGTGGGGRNGGGGAGGGTFDPAAAQQRQMEREKAILDVLDAGQVKRLRELYVQRVGNRVALRKDFQDELGLSDGQRQQITDLQAKQREANASVMEKMRNGEIDRDQIRDIMQKNDKALDEEIGKIFTAEQAGKLKTMAGAPFKFEDNNG
ncbi:MAG: hypothetical protein JSS66_03200 [Armatimonadetes bacterium]|nr:hypothetical protein [Armatimonadota bacterium]